MTHEAPRLDIASATSVPVSLPRDTGRSAYQTLGIKRLGDILGSAICLVLLAPVILYFWWRVRADGGPGFYSQPRIGRGGRRFMCHKLRSMCVDADARMAEHLAADPAAALEWQVSQKLKNDPRITRIGHTIRKYSIDELPQLWNVLKGDMSLIGPRPFMPDQQELYPEMGRAAYEALRPGISGLWQVSARNEDSFAARAAYDIEYRRDLSLVGDIRIALKTLRVMAGGTGH